MTKGYNNAVVDCVDIPLRDKVIEVIHEDFFDVRKNFGRVIIVNNNLRKIEPHAFDKVKYVNMIDLRMNNLTSLPIELFSKNRMLKVLDLSQNNFFIDSFPHDLLRNNVHLTNFTMIQNKQEIVTLPKRFFANLIKLKNLKLTDIGLFYVHQNLLWGSTEIQELYIDRNRLKSIPQKFFRDCRKLTKLVLKCNEISYLPEDIFATLTNLEILDLSYNNIRHIDNNLLKSLSSLRTIKMEHNQLRAIDPEAFKGLKSLQVAHFSYNNLTLKPSEIIDNDALKITYVDKDEPHSVLHFCKDTLEELYVDHNFITEVFSDWITAPRLRILNLAHNGISYLQISELQFSSSIIEVDMSHNEIHRVDFQGVERLTPENLGKVTINIQDNPIRCDCKLNVSLKSIDENIYHPYVLHDENVFNLKVDNLKCHRPESLEHVKINKLSSKSVTCEMIESRRNNISFPQNCKCIRSLSDESILINCWYQEPTTAPAFKVDIESLEVIDAGCFDNKEKFDKVIIVNKNLRKIEPHAFDELKYVKEIDLRMNDLTSLPIGLFSKNTMLQVLDLSQNNFLYNSFPHGLLQNNVYLTNFTMIQNKQRFMHLPERLLADLVSLKYIKLTDTGILTVPRDLIWNSSNLEVFHLDNNWIQSLPADFFKDSKKLKELVLSFNVIDKLPEDIFATLTNLEILDLSYNNIRYIDNNLLKNLSSLRTIKMEHNYLRAIDPEAFKGLKSLQVAHFSYNNLTLKPSEIIDNDALKITYVDKDEPHSVLHFCKDTLEELYVDHNFITEVFSDWITAPRLRILNLAHNGISYLQISELQFSSSIIEVDMSHNEIHRVDFQGVERLTPENLGKVTINIQDNPIRCDCKLNGLLKFIDGNIHHPYVLHGENVFNLKVDNLTCHQPESLKDIKISDLRSQLIDCNFKT
ncbi:chaoptin-like [Chelonus insularis]|uniref:chaoptin-like n=1 Tax=Chelonus insularis TaxID=460826 RepID=UPI00158C76E1|nr:chaoptin-like [Chelonus insularis]